MIQHGPIDPNTLHEGDEAGFARSGAKQEIPTDGMGTGSHFAAQELCRGDVAYGSIASLLAYPHDVRFTPDSDQKADVPDWSLSANGCRKQVQQTTSYSITSSARASSVGGTALEFRKDKYLIKAESDESNPCFSLERAVLKDLANAGSRFDARLLFHMVHTSPFTEGAFRWRSVAERGWRRLQARLATSSQEARSPSGPDEGPAFGGWT